MDELDRLYRRVVDNIRGMFPELLTRGFEVSQLYQQIVPYRTNRRELAFDSNEEYELALMQLLAGLRGYLSADDELQRAMRTELASPNPDLTAFRIYATSTVALAPEPLRALERRLLTNEQAHATPNALSASEQASLAGRATEALDVTGESPAVPTPHDAGIASRAAAAAPRAPTPAAPHRPAARPAPAPSSAPSLPTPAAYASRPAPAPAPAPPPPLAPSMTVPRTNAPPVSAGASCRYCSGALPDGRRVTFCPSCGHNLTVQHCPACATELEVDWKFCITCGRGIEASDATPE